MKKIITVLIVALSVINTSIAQEELHILEADSSWLKEIITLPLGFAQEINFEG
ncbi:hypothetical protein [Winogradskyella sp.]|uniref:hypothetical protein n=1 Tax=Winogradskyella sp. TaxID=1883156 RepID=UPI003F6BE393